MKSNQWFYHFVILYCHFVEKVENAEQRQVDVADGDSVVNESVLSEDAKEMQVDSEVNVTECSGKCRLKNLYYIKILPFNLHI